MEEEFRKLFGGSAELAYTCHITMGLTGGKAPECIALKPTRFMDTHAHYVGNAYK